MGESATAPGANGGREAPGGRRRWLNILIGCSLGCGVLGLLAMGSCAAFAWWLGSPGDVLEPQRLLGEETTGYIEWTLRLEDPGTDEMLRLLFAEFDRHRRQRDTPLPPAIEQMLDDRQSRQDQQQLKRLFPVVLAWTLQPGEAGLDDLHLVSASLRGADHQLVMLDWILGLLLGHVEDVQVLRHAGEKIYVLPEGHVVFIHRGDLFFTADAGAARRAVERLARPLAHAGPSNLRRWLDRLPQLPLRGAVSNAGGEVGRLYDELLAPAGAPGGREVLWQVLSGVSLGGEFTMGGAFDLRIHAHFPDPASAEAVLAEVSRTVELAAADGPFDVTRVEREENRVVVVLRLEDLPSRLGASEDEAVPAR